MAEMDKINNPNNTDTWKRRGGNQREMDNDGVSNASSDKDYFGNLKKFERHDNMAAEPTRNKAGEPGQKR